MKIRKRLGVALGAGMLLAGLAAAPASATVPLCAGTQGTAVVCVDPTGGTLIEDCVYAGPPPCTPVTVPGPTVQCGGATNLVQALCALIRA